MIAWRYGTRPQQSGMYLVLYKNACGSYHFLELNYSAKYQLWNYWDNLGEPAEGTKDWDVILWVPVEEVIPDLLLKEGVK